MARPPRQHESAATELSTDPLHDALARLLERRGLTVGALASLLRAEGIAISRTRLHQLLSGQGAPASSEQLERLASVVGVVPEHFAEYRLWRVRTLIDPAVVGFDRAMANLERLTAARALPAADEPPRPGSAGRYPGRTTQDARGRG